MKKISLISGGSSGLGIEIAGLLISAGKNVVILGRDQAKLKSAVTHLNHPGLNCTAEFFQCNVGIENDVSDLGRYLTDKNYVPEYLFNNAGRGLFLPATGTTSELIDSVFESNLKGLILLTTEVLRITPESEELSIVNIMSTSALLGRADETIYCAAKWGARGYTEALRTELKGKKRNIISVYPGGMKTNFWNVTGPYKDISEFMDPNEVAEKIVNAVLVKDKLSVTEITINRK